MYSGKSPDEKLDLLYNAIADLGASELLSPEEIGLLFNNLNKTVALGAFPFLSDKNKLGSFLKGFLKPVNQPPIASWDKLRNDIREKLQKFKPFSKRGQKVTLKVDEVGEYFPFVNREKALIRLWNKLVQAIEWTEKYSGTTESKTKEGSQFIVCFGAPGIGKTTFATDGFWKLSEEISKLVTNPNKEHVRLLQDCVNSGRILQLSFAAFQIMEGEINNIEACLSLRILHQYLYITKSIQESFPVFFQKFKDSKITVLDVLQLIKEETSNSTMPLFIIHIDEAQNLMREPKTNPLIKMLDILWNIKNSANLFYLLVVLTGTNALEVYKLFLGSTYRYSALSLPLLKSEHVKEIVKSINRSSRNLT